MAGSSSVAIALRNHSAAMALVSDARGKLAEAKKKADVAATKKIRDQFDGLTELARVLRKRGEIEEAVQHLISNMRIDARVTLGEIVIALKEAGKVHKGRPEKVCTGANLFTDIGLDDQTERSRAQLLAAQVGAVQTYKADCEKLKAEPTVKGALQAARVAKRKAKEESEATEKHRAIASGRVEFEKLFKLQRFDIWSFSGLEAGFGKPWPGNLPASLVANVLYYFTEPDDLVIDPMAGGGVTGDVCCALNRRCEMYDINPCGDRNDIEPHDLRQGAKMKDADLVFFDPPYWTLKGKDYSFGPSWKDWLSFLGTLAEFARDSLKPSGRCAVLMQDSLTIDVPAGEYAALSTLESVRAFETAGFEPLIQISVPLSTQQADAREMEWAKRERRLLGRNRVLTMYGRNRE